jgi:hypothetical protein
VWDIKKALEWVSLVVLVEVVDRAHDRKVRGSREDGSDRIVILVINGDHLQRQRKKVSSIQISILHCFVSLSGS